MRIILDFLKAIYCYNDNFIYLIQGKINIDPDSIYASSIIFRKKEVFTTGIKNKVEIDNFIKIFPNPSKDEIYIHLHIC